jgi:hypothetical protein
MVRVWVVLVCVMVSDVVWAAEPYLTQISVFTVDGNGTRVHTRVVATRAIHANVVSVSLPTQGPGDTGFVACVSPATASRVTLTQPSAHHGLVAYTNTSVPSTVATLANVMGCDIEDTPTPVVFVYTVTAAWATTSPVTILSLANATHNVSLVVYVNAVEWFPVPVAVLLTTGTPAAIYGWSCTMLSLKPGVVNGTVAYVPDRVLGKMERYGDGPTGFFQAPGNPTALLSSPSTIAFLYFSGPTGFSKHARNPPQHYVHSNGFPYGNTSSRFPNETAVRAARFRMGVSTGVSLEGVSAQDLGMGIFSQWNTFSWGWFTNTDYRWAPEVTQPDAWFNPECAPDNPWCGGYGSLTHARCLDPIRQHYRARTVQIASQIDYYVNTNLTGRNLVFETRAGSLANCAFVIEGYWPCTNATQVWPPMDLAPVVIPVRDTVLELTHVPPTYVQILRAGVLWGNPGSPTRTTCAMSNVTITSDNTHAGVALSGTGTPAYVAADSNVYNGGPGGDLWGDGRVAAQRVFLEIDLGQRIAGVIGDTVITVCTHTLTANGTRVSHCQTATAAAATTTDTICAFTALASSVRPYSVSVALPANASGGGNHTATDSVAITVSVNRDTLTERDTAMRFPSQDQPPVVLVPPRQLWPGFAATVSPSSSTGVSSSQSPTKSPSLSRTSTPSATTSHTPSTSGSVTATQTFTPSTTFTVSTTLSGSRTHSASRSTTRSVSVSTSSSMSGTRSQSGSRSTTRTQSNTQSPTPSTSGTPSGAPSDSGSPSVSSSATESPSRSGSRTTTKSLSGTKTPSRTPSLTREWLGANQDTANDLLTLPVIVAISVFTGVVVIGATGLVLWYQRYPRYTQAPSKNG